MTYGAIDRPMTVAEMKARHRAYLEAMEPFNRALVSLMACRPTKWLLHQDGSISTVDPWTPEERALHAEVAKTMAKAHGLPVDERSEHRPQ